MRKLNESDAAATRRNVHLAHDLVDEFEPLAERTRLHALAAVDEKNQIQFLGKTSFRYQRTTLLAMHSSESASARTAVSSGSYGITSTPVLTRIESDARPLVLLAVLSREPRRTGATVVEAFIRTASAVFARIEGDAGSLIQLAVLPLESEAAGATDASVDSAAFPAVQARISLDATIF